MRDWPFSEALLGHPHAAHDPCITALDIESMAAFSAMKENPHACRLLRTAQ